jgi:hypothetical protein
LDNWVLPVEGITSSGLMNHELGIDESRARD